jgi:hypothetical protein
LFGGVESERNRTAMPVSAETNQAEPPAAPEPASQEIAGTAEAAEVLEPEQIVFSVLVECPHNVVVPQKS